MLERGYARLITFECVNPKVQAGREGYEWFGNTAPPHPALTAYGLLQFTDMAKYVNVDKAMLARTQGWLLSQRDKKGGFLSDNRRLDKIGKAPDQITNAYILWALCEADVREDLTLEMNTVAANANKSEDPYMLALAALSLMKRGQHDKAAPMLKTLQAMQNADGSLTSKSTSITLSGGSQLMIETTSLAVLAWQRAKLPGEFRGNMQKAVSYLGKQRGGFGGYGSTQSTVLALKALVGFTRDNKRTAESGELKLIVNGREAAVKTFTAGVQDPIVIELPDDKSLTPDDNAITLEITGKNVFPYTLTWSYMALTPANKETCPVKLETRTLSTKANEGESIRITAILSNVSGQDQGMAVAIIGLPGGCMLPADMQELRKLVQEKKIDAFEIRGRELVLYWRTLEKDATNEVSFSVICQIPGQYRGPASRAYIYYNADERFWVRPLEVEIK
ncbi:MAG TPA: alpha-2-macroglobulin, partial [Gemmataceae bacterium]|nr:alpha-2-macroglobulin [Gemmataceae bacterium]